MGVCLPVCVCVSVCLDLECSGFDPLVYHRKSVEGLGFRV
jgi:hypothetical protein